MSLIERPYQYNFSRNEIRYVWELGNIERAGLYLQVRLMCATLDSGTYEELHVFNLKPDTESVIYLYIQDYLDSNLNYVLPTIGEVITAADDQAVKFYVEYREISDDDADPDFVTNEDQHLRRVIKGGVEKNKFNSNNAFKYIEEQKIFLKWQPSKHFIFQTENVFLTYLNTKLVSDFYLRVVCTATDGTTTTHFTAVTGGNLIYHFNVGPSLLAFSGFTSNQNWYYDVAITNSDGTLVFSDSYRFFSEYRPTQKKYYDLIYFNSLGGVDSVRVFGETAVTISRDADEAEGGLELDRTTRINSFEKAVTNIKVQRQYKGDIGYLRNRSKKQQEAFIDFLVAEKIYQIIDSRWIPVINLQKSADIGKNTDTRQSFPIEWSLSESNESFTPADTFFGMPTAYLMIPENLHVVSITNTDSTRATIVFASDTTLPAATTYTIQLTRLSNSTNTNQSGVNTGISFTDVIRGEMYEAKVRGEFDDPGEWSEPIIVTIPA